MLALFRFGRLAESGALWLVAMLALGCSLSSQADPARSSVGSGGMVGAGGSPATTSSGGAAGSEGTQCTNDSDARCSRDGILEVCKSGQWVREKDCQGAGRCSASRRTCLSCAPGTFACKQGDGTLTQCSLDGSAWEVVRTCDGSDACVADGNVGYCKTCTPGTVSCEPARRDYVGASTGGDHGRANAALRVCNADASGTEPLDLCGPGGPVCDVDAARCRTCLPNQWTCDGSVLARCNARGDELVFAKNCGHPALCDATAGDCKPAGCKQPRGEAIEPGTVACERSTLSVCRPDGKWDVLDICSTETACSDGVEPRICMDAPGHCVAGSSVCRGLSIERCASVPAEGTSGPVGGAYYTFAHCALGCTQVSEFEAECDATGEPGGDYSDAMICEPGTTSYESCSETGCENVSCQSGLVCADNTLGCQVCVPDAYRCDGAKLVRCNAGGTAETVTANCGPLVCDAFRQACLPAKVGERYCDGSRFSTVDVDGNSLLIEDCGAAALCNPAFGCSSSACVLGSRSCDGANVLHCDDGTELTATSERCASAERCEEGLGCAVAARIAAGDSHTCALVVAADAAPDASGYVKCWGANESGQLGNGAPELADEPEARPVLSRLSGQLSAVPMFRDTGLCAGRNFTCADVKLDGVAHVVCWGANDRGQLGFGTPRQTLDDAPANAVVQVVRAPESAGGAPQPTTISGLHAVTCGADFACALDADNRPYCWGANDVGQLGIGQVGSMPSAGAMPVRELTALKALVARGRHTGALDRQDAVYCWGDNGKVQLGQAEGASSVAAAPALVGKLAASALALGRDFSLALTPEGLRAWGQNTFGQLGNGTSVSSSVPTPSSGVQGQTLSLLTSGSSAAHACVLADGALGCWGANPLSALGDDSTVDRYQSVRVKELEGVRLASAPGSVALGKAHSCAIDAEGDIFCWGANQRHQLGSKGPLATAPTAVQVY